MALTLHRKIKYSVITFIRDSRSVGILLLLCTVLSLILANSFWGENYRQFWEITIPFTKALHLPHELLHFINDALMAVFFFLVGLEIKRELISGELSSVKNALLPVVAAVSGVIVPAAIYLLINKGGAFQHGWGIPTATDIAFSLGVIAILGKRVPASLRIFLTALAIIDDLCAIFIIALFYGGTIQWLWLLAAAIISVTLFYFNKLKRIPYKEFFRVILGLLLWYCMFHSGIHATIAGVLFAFLIPPGLLTFYEHKLHTFVNFFVIPIFALANTCIVFPSEMAQMVKLPLTWGIALALLIGKPLGILSAAYFMVKKGISKMPRGSNWHQFIGVGILAGIGFTMSIFVTSLAFRNDDIQDEAKIAVLGASLIAMIAGYFWITLSGKTPKHR